MKALLMKVTVLVASAVSSPRLSSALLPRFASSLQVSFSVSRSILVPSTTATATPSKHQGSGVFGSSTTILRMSSSVCLSNCPTIPLRNGMAQPAIGFGTYKVGFIPASASAAVAGNAGGVERTAEECVSDALSVGYRFLECAEFYGNEHEVGKAIAKSGIDRKDLFICSKVWTTTIEKGPAAIEAQLDKTLSDLGTDYVDLYLIHWPVPGKHVEAYKTICKLQKAGKILGCGVSNYAWEDYLELKEAGVEQLPLVNQIEINPFLYRKNTIGKFAAEGVVMQSYRSLRDGKAFENPTLVKIAKDKSKSPAQILGRWCVQKGFVYVPKSVKRERMEENAEVFDFELTSDEMSELDSLTTPEAIDVFAGLYRKCVNRDTSKDGTMDGVKMDITTD